MTFEINYFSIKKRLNILPKKERQRFLLELIQYESEYIEPSWSTLKNLGEYQELSSVFQKLESFIDGESEGNELLFLTNQIKNILENKSLELNAQSLNTYYALLLLIAHIARNSIENQDLVLFDFDGIFYLGENSIPSIHFGVYAIALVECESSKIGILTPNMDNDDYLEIWEEFIEDNLFFDLNDKYLALYQFKKYFESASTRRQFYFVITLLFEGEKILEDYWNDAYWEKDLKNKLPENLSEAFSNLREAIKKWDESTELLKLYLQNFEQFDEESVWDGQNTPIDLLEYLAAWCMFLQNVLNNNQLNTDVNRHIFYLLIGCLNFNRMDLLGVDLKQIDEILEEDDMDYDDQWQEFIEEQNQHFGILFPDRV
ncbi:hypothetical protein [Aureivirga sp. CE67]|uniref:hypothetical protein n=1 Tax=Aureivirga sp. CE67 TaxID=1788983 RepID=UPI0018C9FD71|nr:hypothetical protein [Aureivirga sp. CE67]